MCGTCGCDGAVPAAGSDGGSTPDPGPGLRETVEVERDVLARNDALAAANREWLAERAIRAVNVMSAPGSGKTTLLAATVGALAGEVPLAVVEGDQAGSLDADRLREAGCRTVQVNTGSGCHLDADMFARALQELDPPRGAVVFVENVGNLVCPALFDLGQRERVVLASTTEGEDKPLKYPQMFRAADVVVLTKLDLVPYLDFDTDHFARHLRRVNPDATLLPVSALSGAGLGQWLDRLRPGPGSSVPGSGGSGPGVSEPGVSEPGVSEPGVSLSS
ncbi:hydrogenase nickel incorporation protein HypB [Saccharomonospora halophila]|uniref:hydrogenase nickel incorporation protein HypB n=1 Tax=Saccharomonospora halophila TaxID=129922 RepID=UPI000A04694B|nr:hydrogenase nickel incorporation protein HypB [Saccharomonospora halophila]